MSKFILILLLLVSPALLIPRAVYAAEYTTTAAVNARSCPQLSCSVVKRLGAGTAIEVLEIVEGDRYNGSDQWLKIAVVGKEAYVHGSLARLVGGLPPVAGNSSTDVPPNSSQGVPTQAPSTPTPALVCGTCSSMVSCDQAYACLEAGYGRLDRDNDGVPCESICGG